MEMEWSVDRFPLSWWVSSQCRLWGQLQQHSLATVAKDTKKVWTLGPEQQTERLMRNLKVRQNRNEGLKEKATKENLHQNPSSPCCTLKSDISFQGSAHSVVALLVFHNLPCSGVMATSPRCGLPSPLMGCDQLDNNSSTEDRTVCR